jgi:hypothetical protein
MKRTNRLAWGLIWALGVVVVSGVVLGLYHTYNVGLLDLDAYGYGEIQYEISPGGGCVALGRTGVWWSRR